MRLKRDEKRKAYSISNKYNLNFRDLLTFDNGLALPLFLDSTVSRAGLRKWRLVHKGVHVMVLFELVEPLIKLIFGKERYHMRQLDVG